MKRMSEMKNIDELNVNDIYQKLLGDSPASDKNLFEMASLKEFRHSAILGYILGRKENGRCVHLESLVKSILPGEEGFDFEKPNVQCERQVDTGARKRPIDVLCSCGQKHLIIENKCNWASDQDNQIYDYWQGVKKEFKCNDEDIYVLYLPPLNNIKRPTDESLGELKERFETDLKGHLIVLSYRELILPWLREDVLPHVCYGNGRLVDSLRSYIDLLEGSYGERSLLVDERANEVIKFNEIIGAPNPQIIIDRSDAFEVWNKMLGVITRVETLLGNDTRTEPEKRSESVSRKLAELNAAMWRIRTFLREQNPLLDVDNLIYEIYWMLRNNPTPFGAKNMKERLDSGMFFVNGRKGSIWDSRTVIDASSVGHNVEVVCDSNALIGYLKGESSGNGNIVTLGIGGVDEESEFFVNLPESYCVERLDNGWTKILVDNKVFEGVNSFTGGSLLYELAKRIAGVAKEFSEMIDKGITCRN